MSENGNKKGFLGTAAWVVVIIFVALLGYGLGTKLSTTKKGEDTKKITDVKKLDTKDKKPQLKPGSEIVYKVPTGNSPVKGAKDDALITVVEFADFQCPFCAKARPQLQQLEQEYAGKVRLYFKHLPLPFHQNALHCAKLAVVAQKHGKFWETYDKLFDNNSQLALDNALKLVSETTGLSVDQLKTEMESPEVQAQLDEDKKVAEQLSIQGTPNFFINGRNIVGAQPYDNFKTIADMGLKDAEEASQRLGGAKGDKLYEELMKNGRDSLPKPPPPPSQWVKVDPKSYTPRIGPEFAPVTIIEFSDFQCPFCGRVVPTLKQIESEYKDKVRVFFINLPLPMHSNAKPAAEAAMAANAQGKFWQIHDNLFEKQREWTGLKGDELKAYFVKMAKEIGLNTKKFEADLDNEAIKKNVDEDAKYAQEIGARGTPHFFINGKRFSGAQPFDKFKTEIDEAIKTADEELKKGTKLKDLYDKLMSNLPKNEPPPPSPTQPAADVKPVDVKAVGAPLLGPKNAKVTIVEFSDFQCPFCKRGAETVEELVNKDYKGKISLAFKHLPLGFHKNAKNAAIAAAAADRQGRFWEMHDKLFGDQARWSNAPDSEQALSVFADMAKELGMNVDRFKKDFKDPAVAKTVEDDSNYANELGIRGTPHFFINGTPLSGAQPKDNFKEVIDKFLNK